MKIHVGSTNPAKVLCVDSFFKKVFREDRSIEVSGVKASSQVSEQPFSLDETLAGAENRARNGFRNCDLSVGLEGGIFPYKDGERFLQVCAGAIFDGDTLGTGLSSIFEVPKDVIQCIKKENADLNEALYRLGYTDSPKVGKQGGAVGLFTKGMLKRPEYMGQALQMAAIPFLQKWEVQER